MTDKAKQAPVSIGGIELSGFQMPDGSYRMSQAQAAECVNATPMSASRFLQSKAFKALKGEGYTDNAIEQIAIDSTGQTRGETRINALPLDIVMLFWLYQCSRGNKQALSLLAALGTESIERRFDVAFGVNRSEDEYNQRLADRLQRTEQQLTLLADAYAEPDVLRAHITQLEEQIRQLGGEPWQLPELDEED